jgi:hypothetical protein
MAAPAEAVNYNDAMIKVIAEHLPAPAIKLLPTMMFAKIFMGPLSPKNFQHWKTLEESCLVMEVDSLRGVAIHVIQLTEIINRNPQKVPALFGAFQYKITWTNKKCLNTTHTFFFEENAGLTDARIHSIHLRALQLIIAQIKRIPLDELGCVAQSIQENNEALALLSADEKNRLKGPIDLMRKAKNNFTII